MTVDPLAPYMQVQAIPHTSEPEILLIRPSFGPEDPRWAPLIQQAREVADLACYTPIVVPAGMSVDVVSLQEAIRKLEDGLPRGHQWRDVATDPPPTDGTKVLAVWGMLPEITWYSANDGGWQSDNTGSPSHWMPLPDVPKPTLPVESAQAR
jgi:hypothetical protein